MVQSEDLGVFDTQTRCKPLDLRVELTGFPAYSSRPSPLPPPSPPMPICPLYSPPHSPPPLPLYPFAPLLLLPILLPPSSSPPPSLAPPSPQLSVSSSRYHLRSCLSHAATRQLPPSPLLPPRFLSSYLPFLLSSLPCTLWSLWSLWSHQA